jgi:hypothetical protein
MNPYFRSKEAIAGGWRHDGWGAALIVECGRAFDFLTWYRPLRAPEATAVKPDLPALLRRAHWVLQRPGTLGRAHLRKMEIELIGGVFVDEAKFDQLFPKRPSGLSEATSDISIANRFSMPTEGVPAANYQPTRKVTTVKQLGDILRG